MQKTYEGGKKVEETITIDNFSGKDVSVQIDYDLTDIFTVTVEFGSISSEHYIEYRWN